MLPQVWALRQPRSHSKAPTTFVLFATSEDYVRTHCLYDMPLDTADRDQYDKHFIPLESDPSVFSVLMHQLGVSKQLRFTDVFDLNEFEAFCQQVFAVVVVYPDTDQSIAKPMHFACDVDGGVLWIRQTINNACGLYAILHAVCNGPAKKFLGQFECINVQFH